MGDKSVESNLSYHNKRGRPQRVEESFTKRKNNEHGSDSDITHGSYPDRNSKASTLTMDQSKAA